MTTSVVREALLDKVAASRYGYGSRQVVRLSGGNFPAVSSRL